MLFSLYQIVYLIYFTFFVLSWAPWKTAPASSLAIDMQHGNCETFSACLPKPTRKDNYNSPNIPYPTMIFEGKKRTSPPSGARRNASNYVAWGMEDPVSQSPPPDGCQAEARKSQNNLEAQCFFAFIWLGLGKQGFGVWEARGRMEKWASGRFVSWFSKPSATALGTAQGRLVWQVADKAAKMDFESFFLTACRVGLRGGFRPSLFGA